jgi:predicted nucleic acid-binding protein
MSKRRAKALRNQLQHASKQPRSGLTFDTGALIQLEKKQRVVARMFDTAVADGVPIRVPAAAVAEFWRGTHRPAIRELIESATVETSRRCAQLAGEALRATNGSGASVVDAIVAATAHEYGDRVITTDPGDLRQLADVLGGLRIIAV